MITVFLFIQIVSFSLGLSSLIVSIIHYLKTRNRTILYYVLFLLIFSARVFLSSLLFSLRLDQSLYYIFVMITYQITKDLCQLFMFFVPAMLVHLLVPRYEKMGRIILIPAALLSLVSLSVPYIFRGSMTGGAFIFKVLEWVTPVELFGIGIFMPILLILNWKTARKNSLISGMTAVLFLFFYGFILFDWVSARHQMGFLSVRDMREILFQLGGYLFWNLFFLIITIRILIRFQTPGPISDPDERFFSKYAISEREKEILLLILRGMNTQTIGEKLFISQKTVKNHVHHIYNKTGVSSRMELAFLIRSESGQ